MLYLVSVGLVLLGSQHGPQLVLQLQPGNILSTENTLMCATTNKNKGELVVIRTRPNQKQEPTPPRVGWVAETADSNNNKTEG